MAETADHVARVAVIVRMATERRVQAQFAALVGRADVLVNGVHGLEDAAGQLLEFAKFHRLLHAMVLQIIHPLRRLKGARAGDCKPIHVRKFALLGGVGVISGSESQEEISVKNLSSTEQSS